MRRFVVPGTLFIALVSCAYANVAGASTWRSLGPFVQEADVSHVCKDVVAIANHPLTGQPHIASIQQVGAGTMSRVFNVVYSLYDGSAWTTYNLASFQQELHTPFVSTDVIWMPQGISMDFAPDGRGILAYALIRTMALSEADQTQIYTVEIDGNGPSSPVAFLVADWNRPDYDVKSWRCGCGHSISVACNEDGDWGMALTTAIRFLPTGGTLEECTVKGQLCYWLNGVGTSTWTGYGFTQPVDEVSGSFAEIRSFNGVSLAMDSSSQIDSQARIAYSERWLNIEYTGGIRYAEQLNGAWLLSGGPIYQFQEEMDGDMAYHDYIGVSLALDPNNDWVPRMVFETGGPYLYYAAWAAGWPPAAEMIASASGAHDIIRVGRLCIDADNCSTTRFSVGEYEWATHSGSVYVLRKEGNTWIESDETVCSDYWNPDMDIEPVRGAPQVAACSFIWGGGPFGHVSTPTSVYMTVEDSKSEDPITDATVTASDGVTSYYPDHEWEGLYRFFELPEGTYTVVAQATGYTSAQQTAVVPCGDGVRLTFELVKNPPDSCGTLPLQRGSFPSLSVFKCLLPLIMAGVVLAAWFTLRHRSRSRV